MPSKRTEVFWLESVPTWTLKALLDCCEQPDPVWVEFDDSQGVTLSCWGRDISAVLRFPCNLGTPGRIGAIEYSKFHAVVSPLRAEKIKLGIANGLLVIGTRELKLIYHLPLGALAERIAQPAEKPNMLMPVPVAMEKILLLRRRYKIEAFYSMYNNMLLVSFRLGGKRVENFVVLARGQHQSPGLVPYPFLPRWALVCENGYRWSSKRKA